MNAKLMAARAKKKKNGLPCPPICGVCMGLFWYNSEIREDLQINEEKNISDAK